MQRNAVATNRHLMRIGQAAEYAGVSTKTLRRRIADGSVRGFRAGPRVILIDKSDLDAMLRPIPTTGGHDA